jgi:hypothetical protein
MERSDEVANDLAKLLGTFGTPAMGSAFSAAISSEPGVLVIGSDPDEWWDEPEKLTRVVAAQADELQGVVSKVVHSEGWTEGQMGWGAARVELAVPDGPATTMRLTATYARRDGGWKIVQAHASVGVPNEETTGQELTT